MKHLVFQMHGPMASWGQPAVGEDRPTAERPTRSAILGLLAAGLGLRRRAHGDQRALRDGYGVAVRLEHGGTLLRDYHTTQVPSRKDKIGTTRKDELNLPSQELNTILSRRDYRSDFLAFVAVWAREGPQPWSLEELAESLNKPHFRPSLGRRSCPPALPFAARVEDAPTLLTALSAVPQDGLEIYGRGAEEVDIYWDADHPEPGLDPLHELNPRDEPLDRTKWRFTTRNELHGRTAFGGAR